MDYKTPTTSLYKPPIITDRGGWTPRYRIIIEKRRVINDRPGVSGVFIIECDNSTASIQTTNSVNGAPGTADINLIGDTKVLYLPFNTKEGQIESKALSTLKQVGLIQSSNTLNSQLQLVIPNRDLLTTSNTSIDLDTTSLLDLTGIKSQVRSLNTVALTVDADDLIYIDSWSTIKQKLLPVFTGTIVKKRRQVVPGQSYKINLVCEDMLYFLRQSRYVTSPSVINEASNAAVGQEKSEVTIYKTKLVGLSAFEAILTAILSDGSQKAIEDYLDKDGRIDVSKRSQDSDVIPLRAPVLSRIERILAYPYTMELGQRWTLIQSESKTRLDICQEIASNLEVEFFAAETGELVFKFPTRLDGFLIPGRPPVNFLPRNNLGRSAAHTKEAQVVNKGLDLISKINSTRDKVAVGNFKNSKHFRYDPKNPLQQDQLDFLYVDPRSELLLNPSLPPSLIVEMKKGGEIPTVYSHQVLTQTYEDNVEKVITAGSCKINNHWTNTDDTTEEAIVFENGVFFRDVANSRRYGIRYQDFTPQFLRTKAYIEAYVWFKLAVINQERNRATLSCIDDSFFRVGHCIKIDEQRGLTSEKLVPIQDLSVLEKTSKGATLHKGLQQAEFYKLNMNTSRKLDTTEEIEVDFELATMSEPNVYYIESISRSSSLGEGTPTMTLELTAGRSEFNTPKEGGGFYNDAEDQWTKGFYTFWKMYFDPPETKSSTKNDPGKSNPAIIKPPTPAARPSDTPVAATPASSPPKTIIPTNYTKLHTSLNNLTKVMFQNPNNLSVSQLATYSNSKNPPKASYFAIKKQISTEGVSALSTTTQSVLTSSLTALKGDQTEISLTPFQQFVFWETFNTQAKTKTSMAFNTNFTTVALLRALGVSLTISTNKQKTDKLLSIITFGDTNLSRAQKIQYLKAKIESWTRIIVTNYNLYVQENT